MTMRFTRKLKATSLVSSIMMTALLFLINVQSANAAQTYVSSWIGNSFSSGSDGSVADEFLDVYVTPDGTVYTNTFWDESGQEVGMYKDGKNIPGSGFGLHGYGFHGGDAITGNGKYLFVGMQLVNDRSGGDQPPYGTSWYGFERYDMKGNHVPFAGGRSKRQDMMIVNTTSQITGMVVYNNQLFVSDPAGNKIRVYDTETMQPITSFDFSNPGKITVDKNGNLWIIRPKTATTPGEVLEYSTSGKPLGGSVTSITVPSAIAVDPNNGHLLLGDNGPDQNVKIFDISGTVPNLLNTLGDKGGIYSGTSGAYGDFKLAGPTGIGVDAQGNYYVSCNGTGVSTYSDLQDSYAILRSFSPDSSQTEGWKFNWKVLGLQFVDNGVFDPMDPTNIYTYESAYKMDYSQTTPGSEWSYVANTINGFKYPNDPRLNLGNHNMVIPFGLRWINGQKFLYVTGMYTGYVGVYRFDGDTTVPSVLISPSPNSWPVTQPARTAWIWTDSNGDGSQQTNEYTALGRPDDAVNGWYVDASGNIWGASSGKIREYLVQGVDAAGNPIYSFDHSVVFAMPKEFTQLTRANYDASSDTMYVTGYTADQPYAGDWKGVGKVLARYDHWSSAQDRTLTWIRNIPYSSNLSVGTAESITFAGDKVFVVYSQTAAVRIYDNKNGAYEGILTPGASVGSQSGWVDVPNGIQATQRDNGEYLVLTEDDLRARSILYRFYDSGLTPDMQAPLVPGGLSASMVEGTSAHLTWTASTDTDSGVYGYEVYREGVRITTTSGTSYTDSGLMPNSTHTYTIKALDEAFNKSDASSSVTVTAGADVTAPTVPANLAVLKQSDTSLQLAWTPSTDDIGVKDYSIYSGTQLLGTTTDPRYTVNSLTPNTAYTFTVKAEDASGNVSAASSDLNAQTLPTVTIQDLLGSIDASSKLITISGNISSKAVGKQITFRIFNQDGSLNYIGQTTSAENGAFSFSYTTKDVNHLFHVIVGGEGITELGTLDFGAGEPTASVNPVAPNGLNGWYTVPVTVTLSTYGNAAEYTLNGEDTWHSYASPITLDQDGKNTLNYRLTNTTDVQSLTVNIDKTAPVTVATVNPAAPDGSNGWYVHPVTVTLSTYDNLSGVAMTEYSLDGGSTWQSYTAPVTLSQDSKYTVSYRSTDIAGNVEAAKTISFNLDQTAPTITVSGLVYGTYSDSMDITPILMLSDNLSGVDSSKTTVTISTYDVQQNAQQGATIPLYTLPLGSHTFIATSSDLAGNINSQTVLFQTTTSIQSMEALVTRFTNMGWIDNAGIANSLQSKLAANDLADFVSEVKAQSGKHISVQAANYLLRDAQYLLSKQ